MFSERRMTSNTSRSRNGDGNLMRRYWIPALLSEEIPLPDCRRCGCGF